MSDSDSPQSSLADIAKELVGSTNTGSLATHSVKHPEFPFASVINYGVLPSGEPVIFLSSMATHSKNLRANPKVSLLVYHSGDMASARATLVGTVQRIGDDQLEAAKTAYLSANPDAAQWIGFGDFAFLKLDVVECYVVAGFGAMGWVGGGELGA